MVSRAADETGLLAALDERARGDLSSRLGATMPAGRLPGVLSLFAMIPSEALPAVELALRAALAALLLFVGAILLRDRARSAVAWLAAAFAAGVAAYALQAAPGFAAAPAWWRAPLLALSTGNSVVLWLFAAALFNDEFRLRRRHAVVWALLAAAAVLNCLVLAPDGGAYSTALGGAITLATLLCAVLAARQALGSWRADLVERRRRLRLFIVGAGAGYTLIHAGVRLVLHAPPSSGGPAGIPDALVLLAITVAAAWHLVHPAAAGLLAEVVPPAPAVPEPGGAAAAGEVVLPAIPPPVNPPEEAMPPVDRALVTTLERWMADTQAYRDEGLTIGLLALRLGVPEYKLRRAINQGLGYRNFNAFLNRYRLDAAKAALADPARAAEPIVDIAMAAGFQSLGPFNRAFKAEAGMTPSEFRRQRLADS